MPFRIDYFPSQDATIDMIDKHAKGIILLVDYQLFLLGADFNELLYFEMLSQTHWKELEMLASRNVSSLCLQFQQGFYV